MKKPLENPARLAHRIRQARQLTGLSRAAFAEAANLNIYTLRSWEQPPRSRFGLSKSGVGKLLRGLRQCGVICDELWLLTGEGEGPRPVEVGVLEQEPLDAMMVDCAAFLANHSGAVVLQVDDDLSAPYYLRGHCVGGCMCLGGDVDALLGQVCIVGLNTGEKQIRRLAGRRGDRYMLSILNPLSGESGGLVELKYAAEIIWHRWPVRSADSG